MTGIGGSVNRRQFVASSIAGAAGAYALADPLLSRAIGAVPLAGDVAFNTGVASGQVTQRAITLWTQLDGLATPSRLGVEIAKDSGFSRVVARTEALADPAEGGTARVRIRSSAIKPGDRYYYRFISQNGSSGVGQFRAALPPDSKEPIKVAFFACQDFGNGYYSAHRDMAAQDVDLVVCLGDYIYEDAFFPGRVRPVPATPDGQVRTLDEYRNHYRTYNGDKDLQAVRAAAPMALIWDDHEVEDNYAADLPGGNGGGVGSGAGRDIPFLERRANGYKAFFEASPMIRHSREADRTYGAQRFGQLELLKLDTRQYRTDQPCNDNDGFVAFCLDQGKTVDPNATLLGSEQRQWLVNRLKRSDAPWKLIANQVMIMSLDILARNSLIQNTDAWDGYGYERAYICDVLEKNGIKNTHFMTGDIHTYFAGLVSRSGRGPNQDYVNIKGGPAVATEFVVSAITSAGIPEFVTGALFSGGLNNQFELDLEEGFRNALGQLVDNVVKTSNSHITYSGAAYKGYGLVELRADAMKVKYRATRQAKGINSKPFTFASFTVPKDQNVIQQDAVAAQRRGALPYNNSPGFKKTDAENAILGFLQGH